MLGNHALQFGGSMEQIRVNAYNFAARFPTVTFGLSSAAPGRLGADRRAAAWHCRRRPHVGEQPALHALRLDLAARPDVPSGEPDVRVRRRYPERSQLEPRQLLPVHPGQLALEAKRHDSRRREVGVLQPGARGQQPRVRAGAQQRADGRRRDDESGDDGQLLERRDVEQRL